MPGDGDGSTKRYTLIVDAPFAISEARRTPPFRRCRFDIRGQRTNPERVIVALGQVHPVLRGRFEAFQARKIARVQAWIFDVCDWFYTKKLASSFGQEGFTRDWGQEQFEVRLPSSLLQRLVADRRVFPTGAAWLQSVSKRWRTALRHGHAPDIAFGNTALNGLVLMQMEYADVAVFPIEQTQIHSGIAGRIEQISVQITQLESVPAFLAFRRKQGRGLLPEEYRVAKEHGRLVGQFNRTLTSPERDRSIWLEVLRAAQARSLTVFVLGQGHRAAQLKLVSQELPAGYQFIWITPPMLWWWQTWSARVGWVLLIACLLGLWWVSQR
jgi:hypothetical protein